MPTPAKFTISVCLAAGVFFAGYMANRQPAPVASSATVKQVLYYTCPMHPQYKSDHPGDAPCCGMRLVPVYAGGGGSTPDPVTPDQPGMVQISAAKQQLIGVRTDEVKRASASHLLRVPGRITVDDARLYRLIAAADGWIRELGQNTAGSFVKQNQVLASYYTRDLLAAQQTYLFNLATNDQLERGEINVVSSRTPSSVNLQVTVDSLRSLGMSDLQIEEIKRTRASTPQILIYSPITGFVLARSISPGQRFDKGTEMYRIADIGHVWVMTDVFEKDREFVKPGGMATVRYQGREYRARMSDALPQLDPQTRTLKARFELDNPGYLLWPDMFVDVELQVHMPAAITAPADAILDSGRRKAVFVERGDGMFEPRLVEAGWRLGDRVEITKGLEPGERIVVSGNFLIDSESRMKLAAVSTTSMAEKVTVEKDPVCGMEVDAKAPDAIKAQYGGKTYYFCSDHCKKTFQANPGKYVPNPKKMSAQDTHRGRGPA
jgi:Cu(I)/Ag(I) efflux system membrane fusion protein